LRQLRHAAERPLLLQLRKEAVLHHASTREFLHEFIGHYVALEGKLWGSLKR
jgi:hypothetical protein